MKEVMKVSIEKKFENGEYVIGLKVIVEGNDGHVYYDYVANKNIYLDKIDESTDVLILEAVASNVLRSKRKNDFKKNGFDLEKVMIKLFDESGSYQEREILL